MTEEVASVSGAQATIGESLTVGHAAEIRARLLAWLAAEGDLVIDLHGVRAVDVAGLQLLCAAHRSAMAAGKGLVIRGGHDVFRDALRVTGLADARGCDRDCPWQEENSDG